MAINPDVMKRLERSGGRQDKHGKCIICTKPFQTCPHTRAQIDNIIMQWVLGRF